MRPFPRPRPAELVAVAALLVLGTTLRFWRLDLGWFGVDQARDIQTALDIAAGRDWPTVGPTMRRVTSLGALYYYVWALPHLVSDDPLAAYRFAAVLGVLALAGTWAFARRAWGARAALVSLAVLATARIAVIDGRVAWAPAALPAMAVLLLWLLAGPVTAGRMAALGAALGVAVQLHLAMVAWALAAVALVLLQRPGRRALAAGTVGALVTGSPALYAALANAGRDAGIATLPSRGPLPNLLTRASAVASLEWHVPSAFWQWPDASEPAVLVSRGAAVLIAIAAALGIGRLVAAIRHGERPAIVVSTILVCQLAMVALLPGEAWYYYLDPMLPLVALAAGALVGETAAARPRPVLTVLAASVIVAALWLGGQSGRWLAASARHGYLALDPSALTLDGHGGRDAAAPGRLLSLGAKRAVATVLADEPADFATRWRATHGPAFDDVTGDNGFWLARVSSAAPTPSAPSRHAALWYRDDPAAPTLATPGFELVDLGPLRLVRYAPAIAYDRCRAANGPVAVPVRVVPAPRRYGDGTIARSPDLPARIECELHPGSGATRVVAAVTTGTVALQDAAGTRSPAGATSTLCIAAGDSPAPFIVEIERPSGTAGDLDLYERPDPACRRKIAP